MSKTALKSDKRKIRKDKVKEMVKIVVVMLLAVFLVAACSVQKEPPKESTDKTDYAEELNKDEPPAKRPINDNSRNSNEGSAGNSKIKQGIISGPPGIKTDNFEDNSFWSLAVSPKNPDLIYLGSEGNGIFKSLDGGATWTWQRNGLLYFQHEPPSYPSYPEAHDTAIDPNNDNTAYMTMMEGPGPVTGVVASCTAGLYKTVDGGETWVRKVNGLNNSSVCSVAIDEANTSTVFIGVNGGMGSLTLDNTKKALFEGGIYKSIDSGENWSFKKIPIPGSEYNDFPKIQIFNSNTIYASGECWDDPSKAVGLLKSTDAGENWSVISPEGQYIEDFDVALSNNNTIYINIFPPNAEQKISSGSPEGKKYGIYKSIDGGRTWTKTSAIAYGTLRVSPHDEKTVLFSKRGKIFKSSDGLKTYHEVFSYKKEPDILITDIEFSRSDPDIVYAASEGLLVMKSTDGGETFIEKANLRKFMDSIAGNYEGQSTSGGNGATEQQPVSEGKNPGQDASIVISLPFTKTNKPYEMMPMGETINNPDPPNIGGHPGIDFMWNDSVDIIACIDGIVDKVEKTGSHNKWDVFVNTGDFYVGYTTLENVDENIKVGARVKFGQKIGESGNFGTHYMIHWEIGKIKGHERICPMAYFDEASRQRIIKNWAKTKWPEMKKQFPNICNGYYRCEFCRKNGY